MPIKQRSGGFQVRVNRASALEGYQRIRTQVNGSYEQAEEREREINRALDKYGKWPVSPKDRPLDKAIHQKVKGSGTLRQAYRIALDTYWKDMRWGVTVRKKENLLCGFFEQMGYPNLGDIDSKILDKFVEWRQTGVMPGYSGTRPRVTNSTTRKDLAIIKKVNDIAMARVPPLSTRPLPIPSVTVRSQRKWFLKPELMDDTFEFIETDMDAVEFADFCRSIVYQGPRVEENMRISVDDFSGMGTSNPVLRVPGTKTESSDRTIAVWDFMVPIYQRNIDKALARGRKVLWDFSQEQLRHLWMDVRVHLGVQDEPTATMKALRRTFAWFAKTKGLDVEDIKNILGHSDIHTTEGYLKLFGDPGMELSRAKVNGTQVQAAKGPDWLTDAIKSYKDAVDPTPAEMALFVKTLKE